MKTIETFEQPGDVVTLVAPYDVTGGDGLLVGIIFGIAAYQVASRNGRASGKPSSAADIAADHVPDCSMRS